MLPVEIINADVLPSLLEDEQVQLQMIAFPMDFHYYADDEAYAADQPADDFGKKWMIGEGALFPSGFLSNHKVDRSEEDQNDELDLIIQFNARVNRVMWGVVELGGQKTRSFVYCNAETEYGPLDFVHAYDQVPEEERALMKEGSIIAGACILSGDAVIYDYEDGIILDHEHDLRLLRDCLQRGDEERLRAVLAEDAEFISSETAVHGVEGIVSEINKQRGDEKSKLHTFLGEISSTSEIEEGMRPTGTRCIVIADDDEDNYVSILFIDVNEEGKIRTIQLTTDSRYRFDLDRPMKPESILKDLKVPESPVETILARAKLHGLVDHCIDEKQLLEEDYYYINHRENAERMILALKDDPQPDIETALENLFGYMFAKAIEQTRNENRPIGDGQTRLTASYSPGDAFTGELHSTLDPAEHEKLLKAWELGKQFFNDFRFFVEANELPEDQFEGRLAIALAAVQRIGQLFTPEFLPDDSQ